jgi:hypothetical protein
MLANPSIPEAACREVVQRIGAGEQLDDDTVSAIIKKVMKHIIIVPSPSKSCVCEECATYFDSLKVSEQ